MAFILELPLGEMFLGTIGEDGQLYWSIQDINRELDYFWELGMHHSVSLKSITGARSVGVPPITIFPLPFDTKMIRHDIALDLLGTSSIIDKLDLKNHMFVRASFSYVQVMNGPCPFGTYRSFSLWLKKFKRETMEKVYNCKQIDLPNEEPCVTPAVSKLWYYPFIKVLPTIEEQPDG